MARQIRADFKGALHHVYNRGLDGRPIFGSDADRELFLDLLARAVSKFGWIVHVYTLMTNHFHLLIETPEGGLSRGMQEMLTNYVQSFNRAAGRKGHLFHGRFKSQLVEKESYLLELARYIVLIRCGRRWSSARRTTAGRATGQRPGLRRRRHG